MAAGISESNKRILEISKNLLKKVILPQLDDQTLLSFGCICKLASKYVDDSIRYRGIVLRGEVPGSEHPKITLTNYHYHNDDESSHDLSMAGSLESGLLCAKRYKKLKTTGKEISLTHDTEMDPITLKKIIDFCEVSSSKDSNEMETWVVKNLEEARVERLVDIIKGAEELKIEGILRRSVALMARHIKSKTAHQIRVIFGFQPEDMKEYPGYNYDGNDGLPEYEYDHEKEDLGNIKSMRHFLELMIPSLDDSTYLRFASANKSCARLLNNVQSRSCFVPLARERGPWNITLFCCDGKSVKATKDLMQFSGLIKNFQIDHPIGEVMNIKLISISSHILSGIIKFCDKHGTPYLSKSSLNTFDSEFIQNFKLFDLAHAAETLKIHCLLNLVVSKIISTINHKQPKEIRATFGIQNDFDKFKVSSETSWWGKHEHIAFCRTKIFRSLKEIIPWEDVEDESDGPEPSHQVRVDRLEDDSDKSEGSEDDDEKSEGSELDGSEEDEENVGYVVAIDKDLP